MQSAQLERINKEIELRHNRKSNLEIRNGWLQSKTLRNYQSEYDRIRGELGAGMMPYVLIDKLKNRKSALEKLGAQAVNGIRN